MTDPREKARALYDARRTRTPVEPFSDTEPDLGTADGYAVQEHFLDLLLVDGDRVVGRKVGLTSEPTQRLLGVTLTRSGELLDTGAGAAVLGDPVAVVAWLANA